MFTGVLYITYCLITTFALPAVQCPSLPILFSFKSKRVHCLEKGTACVTKNVEIKPSKLSCTRPSSKPSCQILCMNNDTDSLYSQYIKGIMQTTFHSSVTSALCEHLVKYFRVCATIIVVTVFYVCKFASFN